MTGPGIARRLLAGAALWVGCCQLGCSDDGTAVPFAVELEFGGGTGGSRQCRESCDAYGLSCGATLGVRVVDAEDSAEVYDFRCLPVRPATDLCQLGDPGVVAIVFKPLPVGLARVEVSLWDSTVVGSGECINRELFDLQGEPLAGIEPAPVVAGAAYVDIGSDAVVRVPMACLDPVSLDGCE